MAKYAVAGFLCSQRRPVLAPFRYPCPRPSNWSRSAASAAAILNKTALVQTHTDGEIGQGPRVESLRIGSSYECRVPQFRHRCKAPAEFAGLELPLLDLLG
jgi:hypothetical protein